MAGLEAETGTTQRGELRPYREVTKGYTPILDGDLLVAKITPCFENGKIAQARLQTRIGFGSTEFHVIRPRPSAVDARYLLHYLRQPRIRVAGEMRMTGSAGQRRVPESYLAQLRIPLPSLAEQRRIADILDRADALRAKRRAGLALPNEVRQSLFISRFGDPRPGKGESTAHTPVRRMGDLVRIRTGKLDANAADDDGKYPFFTCAVRTLRINTPAFECKAVLVAGNGDLNVKYYEGAFNAYQRTYVIESLDAETLNPRFLYAFLGIYVSELRRQAIGGVIKYIKLPYLTDASIPLPTQKVQEDFVGSMDALDNLMDRQTTSVNVMHALFASLQHLAFRGEL